MLPDAPNIDTSRIYAVDCEMVNVGFQAREIALARVVIVDFDGKVVLDSFVKPTQKVMNYQTAITNLHPSNLLHAPTLSNLLPSILTLLSHPTPAILIGHALFNDLSSLRLAHPHTHVRDTTLYYPFRDLVGIDRKKEEGVPGPGLKRLVREVLGEERGREFRSWDKGGFHDPIEDARATLDLYKSVMVEWERDLALGLDVSEGVPGKFAQYYC
ncbi:ribonuclease H-like domain-containing protein [Mrakia frigida]|uniref:ribonuclease H-like domain-containing protein n=1 Tax=Mrakia frigida TaxID=29902 RepID=UPI003FCC0BA4